VANPRDQFEPNEKTRSPPQVGPSLAWCLRAVESRACHRSRPRSVAVKTQGAVESFDSSKFPDLRFMEPMTGIEHAYSVWEVFRPVRRRPRRDDGRAIGDERTG
jgi:hypothetical protein